MAVEQVIVAQSDHDQVGIHARVKAQCQGCSANAGCGHYLLETTRWRHDQPIRLTLPAHLAGKVTPGDTLSLTMRESRLMQLAVLLYGLPLLTMLSGTVAGSMLAPASGTGESWSILGAIVGLGAGLYGLSRLTLPVPARLQAPLAPVKTLNSAGQTDGENRDFSL